MLLQHWYNATGEEVCRYWQTDLQQGLSASTVKRRSKQFGPNRLAEGKKVSAGAIFIAQFSDFMVVVLLAAVLLSSLLGQWDDALTILAIVIINAILGFVQEYNAERALASLKKLNAPAARCLRNGKVQRIMADELVPGDIIYMETGDRVPADARLLASINLECNESILTGESLPVGKTVAPLVKKELAPSDQKNMVFTGTTVTRGKGKAVVVATGMNTEMGRIATMLERVGEEPTPLQRRLSHLGQWLVGVCILICLAVVFLGIWRGESVFNMVMAGISLAVAAIPEGLPAIVTVSLALGVQRMIRRRALIRKLPAVETLGCATVICSDKTGTLTKNEMTVREIFADGKYITVSGEGYEPQGCFYLGSEKTTAKEEHLARALTIACLCNNCVLYRENNGLKGLVTGGRAEKWQITGEPTEGALLVAAAKGNLWREKQEALYPRILEVPFEAERRRMSTVHKMPKGKEFLVCTKGAPDVILELATGIYEEGKIKPLTQAKRQEIQTALTAMTGRAMRVLALAMRTLPELTGNEKPDVLETNLVFVGLIGMIDPPREGMAQTIARCHTAGIKVAMVTGDHPNTAAAIAKELGICGTNVTPLLGDQLDKMGQRELERRIEQVSVYARVSPRHKLRIVKALKKQGHIVAMTGDGINDAPAVKEADIGIAMGLTGTDVTKEASAMVIQDDNFASIVAAIEEGRAIYDNIRKFIRYLLSCNIGEVMTMFFAALLSLPLPLIPIQILWVNLVTDGLPALALGVEPPEPALMERPPRHPEESIFAHGLSGLIVSRGLQIAFCTLIVFVIGGFSSGDTNLARTMAFTTLVILQLFHVFECRSEDNLSIRFLGNPHLIVATLISFLLQLMVLYWPRFNDTFQTVPLNWQQWALIMLVVIGPRLWQGIYRQPGFLLPKAIFRLMEGNGGKNRK
ncbi:MAG: calcium-translocating P-type ATPase, SERCA-type [bacterium]